VNPMRTLLFKCVCRAGQNSRTATGRGSPALPWSVLRMSFVRPLDARFRAVGVSLPALPLQRELRPWVACVNLLVPLALLWRWDTWWGGAMDRYRKLKPRRNTLNPQTKHLWNNEPAIGK